MWAKQVLLFSLILCVNSFNEDFFMQKTVKLVKEKLPNLQKSERKQLKNFVQEGEQKLKNFLETTLQIHVPNRVKNHKKYVSFLVKNQLISLEKSKQLKDFVKNNQWEYVNFVIQLLDLKPQDYGVSGLTFCDKVLICEYVSEVSTV